MRALLAVLVLASGGARGDSLDLASPSVVAVDGDGRELFGVRADEPRAIASLTKIFVALVVRGRELELEAWTRIDAGDAAAAEGGAGTYFHRGSEFKNVDLLHAMLMVSDNRVPTALARSVGLSPAELLDEMNALARRLGLEHTRFVDVTGILGNVSTARELARAMNRAMGDPVLARIMRTRYARFSSRGGEQTIELKSTVQPLWGKRNKIRGGKTGTSDPAGHCMVIQTELADRAITMTFLGAQTRNARFLDYAKLARWVERHTR